MKEIAAEFEQRAICWSLVEGYKFEKMLSSSSFNLKRHKFLRRLAP